MQLTKETIRWEFEMKKELWDWVQPVKRPTGWNKTGAMVVKESRAEPGS